MDKMFSRNFTLLLSGRFLTNIIDSVYYIVIMWLVFDTTSSTFYTGIAGAIMLLPEVLGFLYGPIIDRFNKKYILVISSIIQLVMMILIYILISREEINFLLLFCTIFIIALASEASYPAENSLLPEIVSERNLVKANTLFSIAKQGTDLMFNALTGILISLIGVATLLKFDIGLIFVVFITFSLLKLNRSSNGNQSFNIRNDYSLRKYLEELKEGLSFAKKPLIIKIILPLVFINMVFSGIYVVFPSISAELSNSANLYGILLASLSSGMMIGSILSEGLTNKFSISTLMIIGYFTSGIAWLLFSYTSSESVVFSCFLLFLAGAPIGATNIIYYTLFQIIPQKNMIARLNTITTSLITVAMPIGSILCGLLASMYSPQLVFFLNGILMILLSLTWVLTNELRKLPKISEVETSKEHVTNDLPI